jgi:hypothetical protein
MTASQRAQIVSFGGEMNFDALIPIRPIECSPVWFVHFVVLATFGLFDTYARGKTLQTPAPRPQRRR